MPRLVSPEKPRGALRAEFVDQPRAPELALEHAHHYVANLEHREAVFGVPPLRARADERVLRRQRGGGLDEGVDAGGVSVKHGARFGGQRAPIALDGRGDLEAAHGGVMLDARLADQLRPSAVSAGAVDVHVPEPILGGGEPLPEKGVPGGLGANAGNPVPVADDGYAVVRPPKRHIGRGVGNGGRQIFGGYAGHCGVSPQMR